MCSLGVPRIELKGRLSLSNCHPDRCRLNALGSLETIFPIPYYRRSSFIERSRDIYFRFM